MQGRRGLSQNTRLRGKGIGRLRGLGGLKGYPPWSLGCKEVRMLEWKGLLRGLGPKRHSCGMRMRLRLRLRLGPHPRGWKTWGNPRRKVVLGRVSCEGLLGP